MKPFPRTPRTDPVNLMDTLIERGGFALTERGYATDEVDVVLRRLVRRNVELGNCQADLEARLASAEARLAEVLADRAELLSAVGWIETIETTSAGGSWADELFDPGPRLATGDVDIDLAEPISDRDPSTDETEAVDPAQPDTAQESDAGEDGEELFPDVVDVVATAEDAGSWTFAVTLSSPYDSPDRYADSWRVRNEDGTVYGERFLTHDHANEQPFTRSQSGIEIPDSVIVVVVEGRDQISGWGGETMTIELER